MRVTVANSGTGTLTMKTSVGDLRRKSRILRIINSNPNKETIEAKLLSDFNGHELKKCNKKVRSQLKRKIESLANKYGIEVDPSFGEPLDPEAQLEADMIAGKMRRAARVAASDTAASEAAAAREVMKEKRSAKKARAAAALAETLKKYANAEANGAPAMNGEAAAAPAEAPAAAASSGGGEITPKTIKQLRDATGAGMMDCKKALTESNGDQEAAAEFLRKKGLAQADKKASRVAAEGKIAVSKGSDGSAVMVEVNCETDFVGKDSTFLGYCEKVAETAAATMNGSTSVEELMLKEAGGESLEASRQALVSKIGENIQVRRVASRGNGSSNTVGGYVHMNSIGVLVELEGGSEQLCTDIAMHVAAMNPPFATADDVPSDVLDNERRVLTEQALESGKPESIVEKMVEGRIRKFLEDKCLVSQTYVKDGDMTVQQLLDKNDAKMIGFTRMAVGEGIEKKEDDFAAEVAAMAAGN